MSNKPVDIKLYEKVRKLANKKFESKSGIYRSSWMVKEYLKRGGKYSGKKSKNKGLARWYKEGWVDLNRPIKNSKGKITGYHKCGRHSVKDKGKGGKYPLCRPSKRVTSKTPRTYHSISKKSIKKAKKQKSKVKGSKNIQFGRGGSRQNSDDQGILQIVLGIIAVSLGATLFF
jgi:hypothetical protein